MKKLKFELIDGYGILVDKYVKNLAINDLYLNRDGLVKVVKNLNGGLIYNDDECNLYFDRESEIGGKILFAEKELEFDVPKFNWREFSLGKAKYTNKDIISFLNTFTEQAPLHYIKSELEKGLDNRIHCIKYPKWVLMDIKNKSIKELVWD